MEDVLAGHDAEAVEHALAAAVPDGPAAAAAAARSGKPPTPLLMRRCAVPFAVARFGSAERAMSLRSRAASSRVLGRSNGSGSGSMVPAPVDVCGTGSFGGSGRRTADGKEAARRAVFGAVRGEWP